MASNANVAVHRGVLVAGAIGLLGLGAAGAYLFVRQSSESSTASQPATGPAVNAAADAQPNEGSQPVTITLTKEAAGRAGITLVAVAVSSQPTVLRIPGIGDSKRRRLLTTFGSVQAIRDATPEQIAAVPGFSVKSGQKILDALRASDALAPGAPPTAPSIMPPPATGAADTKADTRADASTPVTSPEPTTT